MSNSIFVSVLMSVFNDEEFLVQSIESILNQSYSNFEFIIINDGSSDNSPVILNKFMSEDPRIKVYNQKNIGLTKSLNRGLKICSGKYIFRQDADDISSINRIEHQLSHVINNKLVLCFSWFNVIDENNIKISSMVFNESYEYINKNLNKGRTIYSHGSACFEKNFIVKIGSYPENDSYLKEDLLLWKKICSETKKVGAIKEYLYDFRLRKSSITKKNRGYRYYHELHNFLFRNQSRLKIIKNSYFLFKMHEITIKELAKMFICLFPLNYTWIFKKL